VQRVLSVVRPLSTVVSSVVVFTGREFEADVVAAGGRFVDLFSRHSLDETDPDSWPPPCRAVTFAGLHADDVREAVAAVRPNLVLSDTFAVVGGVVARMLDLPWINLCAGHAVTPDTFLAILHEHPWVRISETCRRAVDRLRTTYGLENASPFSYVSALSPHLNLYCEPPEFLTDDERAVFAPVAFWGSLAEAPPVMLERPHAARHFAGAGPETLRVYASIGTVIWESRRNVVMRLFEAVARAVGRQQNARAIISLGGCTIDPAERAALEQPGVDVVPYVPQREVLAEADVFITHHGLNSTHEAIACGTPMMSYPFIWDQPGLARTCARLGLAVELVDTPMAEVSDEALDRAFAILRRERPAMLEALRRAREWERAVIADRPAVMARMFGLAR
jgi:UDP:flavonoid glycosyltransferase YjiC (YdhE family)